MVGLKQTSKVEVRRKTMKILVVAPHPDDEVLGVGGTMTRFATEGHEVTVAIVTKGWSPLFPDAQVEQVRAEAHMASKKLGVKQLQFMDLPTAKLNTLPSYEINQAFEAMMDEERPEMVFLPFPGDLQDDHLQVFEAGLVALRPARSREYVKQILCYETPSETAAAGQIHRGGFEPNVWIDISAHLNDKLEAMRAYPSQLQPFPNPRSPEAVAHLAQWRGSTVGIPAAECFILIRQYL
ncbi:MAG: PIG-L family deacetylase [Sedimentisphaerales bacterium]|nr:PIG-L family deacetylase [Sedimentisphaerales bacterium]